MITREEIQHAAALAKIELEQADFDHFSEEIQTIIQMVEELQQVDTEGVEPTFYGNALMDVYREDVAHLRGNTEELLANAPEREGDYICVPEMIESEEA